MLTTVSGPVFRPAFKADFRPVLRSDGSIWLGTVYGLASEIRDESGLVWPLCGLLDGERTVDEIVERMVRDYGADPGEVVCAVELFLGFGWLVDRAAVPPVTLSARDVERHRSTVEFFSNIDTGSRRSPYELLEVLRSTSVTVLGVGGVGGAAASGLVGTGFGRVRLVDCDRVELSNLNRQLLFAGADIGKPKAQAAAERLRALDEGCEVSAIDRRLTCAADVAELIKGSDLVCCCADDPPQVRQWVGEACFELGIPWLTASHAGSKYTLAVFIPGRTGCFGCLVAANDRKLAEFGLPLQEAPPPQVNAVVAASAQIAGHSMALEAAYLRLGLPVQTAGRELHRHLTDYTFQYFVEATPQPDCALGCGARISG